MPSTRIIIPNLTENVCLATGYIHYKRTVIFVKKIKKSLQYSVDQYFCQNNRYKKSRPIRLLFQIIGSRGWICSGLPALHSSGQLSCSKSFISTDGGDTIAISETLPVPMFLCSNHNNSIYHSFILTYTNPLIDLTSRKSSSPQTPPSLPLPDCLHPPNGAPSPPELPFISTIPACKRRATLEAFSLS